MRRIVLICSVICILVVVGVFSWLFASAPQETPTATQVQAQTENADTAELSTPVNTVEQDHSVKVQDTFTETVVLNEPPPLGSEIPKNAVIPEPAKPEVVKHVIDTEYPLYKSVPYEQVASKLWINIPINDRNEREYIVYDESVITTKKVGEEITFTALQFNIDDNATITNIDKLDEDVTRYSGTFPDGARFRLTQSKNDSYALAVIENEDGIYEMEVKNGVGWVMPSQSKSHD